MTAFDRLAKRGHSAFAERGPYCTFCGKSRMEVRKLIAAPTAMICNECVVLALEACADTGGLRDDDFARLGHIVEAGKSA